MDGFLKIFLVSGSEVAGGYNTGAHGDSIKEAYHEKNQVAGGTDGGKGVAAEKVADNQGVGGIVELLEQVAQKKRQCKEQDSFPDWTFGHKCFGL